MGVTDTEVRAFLRGSPLSPANLPDVSDKELREELRRDSLMSGGGKPPLTPMPSPPSAARSTSEELLLSPELQAVGPPTQPLPSLHVN
jgi:hypothetical protein